MSSMEIDPIAAAAASAPTSSMQLISDTGINQTIYVQNLNEKIKVDELKKSLYLVFSQFGNIVEINTRKTYKLRGQAWIIFDQLASATRALREMNNFAFYGKPMRVAYAKSKSDVVSKADGTFQTRPKRKTEDGEDEKKKKGKDTSKSDKHKEPSKKKLRETESATTNGTHAAVPTPAASTTLPPPPPPPAPLPRMEPTPPNNILFVENLPKECTEMMLSMLFQQYQGFQQARLVPGKPGIAFVEFGDPFQSGLAMEALQNFKITANNLMKISFAKK